MSEKTSKNLVRHKAPAEWKLPAEFNEEIGKIIVRYAYFERSVQRSIWALVGVPDQVGRYAVRDPRITDRIQMIRDLAAFRSVKLDEAKLQGFLKLAEWTLQNRDLLCHGIWCKGPNAEWLVEHLGGQHAKDEAVPHRNRRLAPGGIGYSIDELKKVTATLEKLIDGALTLEQTIRRALPPPSP